MSMTTEARSGRPWWLAGGMLGLAFGYFFWYTPYAALAKSLSEGLVPGVDNRVGGLVLLPAAALGTLVGSVGFLAVSGWWRYGTRGQLLGRTVFRPSRTLIAAGFFTSLLVATTTLNYTFAGASILLMLLLMRAGVLILSPIVDAVRRREVRGYSWAALGLSILAVVAALSDVNSYTLTIGAGLSLAGYFTGYIGRFRIMSRVAKTGDERTDRRYLVDEQVAAAVWQVLLCVVLAVIGIGPALGALRDGLTGFLLTPGVIPAFVIGLLYEALFIYGTLIYLDPREYTWCVPANRCASLLSGVVASFGLAGLTGLAAPGQGQLIATGFVFLAILALSYPLLAAAVGPVLRPNTRRLLLFVCGGNTCRSAIAEAVARAHLAATQNGAGWQVRSAGVTATPGTPMVGAAVQALTVLGVPVGAHRAARLSRWMVHQAAAIYCMSANERDAVVTLAPWAADRVTLLDPDGDNVPDPHGQPLSAYQQCAESIRALVGRRLAELAGAAA